MRGRDSAGVTIACGRKTQGRGNKKSQRSERSLQASAAPKSTSPRVLGSCSCCCSISVGAGAMVVSALLAVAAPPDWPAS
jgi:hypothetical protein